MAGDRSVPGAGLSSSGSLAVADGAIARGGEELGVGAGGLREEQKELSQDRVTGGVTVEAGAGGVVVVVEDEDEARLNGAEHRGVFIVGFSHGGLGWSTRGALTGRMGATYRSWRGRY